MKTIRSVPEYLQKISPTRFFILSVKEYHENSQKISNKLKWLGYEPEFISQKMESVWDDIEFSGGTVIGDNLDNKWVIMLFSHTPKQWTYWLTESRDKPNFSDSFMALLYDINYYDSSDIFEHIRRLREEQVDLNKVDFDKEEYIREHLYDVKLAIRIKRNENNRK